MNSLMELIEGQLVFINRTIYADDGTEVKRMNEPVVFKRMEVQELSGGRYCRWWFMDAEGREDFIQGMEEHVEAPHTAEEIFGFRPLI